MYSMVRLNVTERIETCDAITSDGYHKMALFDTFNERIRKLTQSVQTYEAKKRAESTTANGNREPSCKSRNFQQYIDHKLDVFKLSADCWMQTDVVRIEFAKFQIKKRVMAQLCDRICGGQRLLLFMGHSPIYANSIIRGYMRTPLKPFEKALMEHPLIDVVFIDECNTTQKCSKCFSQVVFNHATNRPGKAARNVLCKPCVPRNNILPEPLFVRNTINGQLIQPVYRGETMMDRDRNASRNILYKGLCIMNRVPIDQNFDRRRF